MFYTVQALLLTKNLSFSKHSAVISSFGKEFIKNGIFPPSLHKNISKAFDTRQAGDYGAIGAVSKKTATILIDQGGCSATLVGFHHALQREYPYCVKRYEARTRPRA